MISEWLAADWQLVHLDIDCHQPFGKYGLRRDWERFSSQLDPEPLATILRARIVAASRSGAILSFPSTRILTRAQIDVARSAGICTIVLWGSEELCKEARRARERENNQVLNEKRYDKSNRKAFDTYGCSEYDDVRIEAFSPDGSRWSREHMLSIIASEVSCLKPT